jgi:ArsR family transcriptional regulator
LSRSHDRDDGPNVPAASPWDGLSPVYVRSTAAQRLKALGHPDRLRIVEVLTQHPTTVGEIAARARLSLHKASRHMSVLHAAGIVQRSHRGNHVLYALADREVPRLAAVAYRGAAVQARRLIAAAPDPPEDDLPRLESAGS